MGFRHRPLAARAEGFSAQLSLHLRRADSCEVAVDGLIARHAAMTNSKGLVAAAVRLPGPCILGLGSAHLDGQVADSGERLALLPATLLRLQGRAGPLDAALLVGDVNCTLAPERVDGELGDLPGRLADDLLRAAALPEQDAVVRLSPGARADLQAELASPAGRARLQCLDGCPREIPVAASALLHDACAEPGVAAQEPAVASLRLVPMPPGSFLTYRLCGRDEAALAELGFAGADGARPVPPELKVTTGCVDQCYFSSRDGKAGAIKKRGTMTRLQLGWLDRLYLGPGAGGWRPEAVQGEPVLVRATGRDGVLDHLLVPWLVTLRKD
mmetsp:Transcript_159570/g.488301  ORF Transcript_159570/g.488301 Transcript_159570/m.488301 type:complete len:328 (+) Transcript_159570:286-1269(+)